MSETEVATKPHEHDDNPFSVDEIEPRLFLGNATAVFQKNWYFKENLTYLLAGSEHEFPEIEEY